MTGVLSDVLLFVAFEFTSFSKAFALFFTSTLIAPFLGRAILGEAIKKWDIIAIMLGFGGMLMLVNPFGSSEDPATTTVEADTEMEEGGKMRDLIGCGIAVLAATNAALAIIYVRKLSDQVHVTLPPLYYWLIFCLSCPIWSLVLPVKEVGELTVYTW